MKRFREQATNTAGEVLAAKQSPHRPTQRPGAWSARQEHRRFRRNRGPLPRQEIPTMWPFSSRKAHRAVSSRRRPAPYRPRLEALEDRYCPSGGALDPTFGTGGLVTTAIGSSSSHANAVITQPDGKIVAGGSSVGEFT